jgi:hypothetical protein
VTRALRPAAAYALAESVLEKVPAPLHAEAFNLAIFQALGPAGNAYICTLAEDLNPARLRLAADARGLASHGQPIFMLSASAASAGLPQCIKASQGVVDIETPTGIMQLTVPATARQVSMSD